MALKTSALVALALLCAGCVGTPYRPAQTQPPSAWSGQSGWRLEPSSIRVNRGKQSVGAVIVEQDASLARTGIIKHAVSVRDESGAQIIIPAGSKAFATNFTLMQGGRSVQKFDPIEWCVVLANGADGKQPSPETVCIAWESAESAHYARNPRKGGLAFLPSPYLGQGMRGPVPEIEEAPVDLGVRFTKQMRVVELDATNLKLESSYSDGTHVQRSRVDSHKWDTSKMILMRTDDYTLLLRATDDKTVQVHRLNDPDASDERTVLLNVLVGVDGRVKDARIEISSGSAELDTKTLEEVKRAWQLKPGEEKGQPREKWGRFAVTFKFVD